MERITRVRAGILLVIFLVSVVFFAFRVYDLQIIQTDGTVSNQKTFTIYTRVKAARGDILDKNGNKLVTNRASYDLTLNHYVLLSANGTNDYLLKMVELCRKLDVTYVDHFPVSKTAPFTYTLSDYNSTWQGYFQKYLPSKGGLDSDITAPLLMKKLRSLYRIPEEWSDEDARAVIGLRYEMDLRRDLTNLPIYVFIEDASTEALSAMLELNVPGLNTEASTVREYSTKYAAHILGYCSAMTAKQWEEYKQLKDENGKNIYEMDALVGQSGLEASFEEYLHGIDGLRKDVVAVDGTLISQSYVVVPKAGKNVELTIDLNLQMAAEDSLAKLIEDLRASAEEGKNVDGADAEGGAVVVMNVKTGAVLACASYPTYDLSKFFEEYESITSAQFAPLFNRALQGEYPPGSTYKMSMVVAGINSEKYGKYSTIRDKGVFEINGWTANCLKWTQSHGTHGSITAMEALKVSCNYFFYEMANNLSIEQIDSVAKGLGLGEHTGIELGEKIGYRANPENKKLLYTGYNQKWYEPDQVMAGIGQSINKFTPMQLCVYTTTLANRGTRYKATFLNRVVSSDYRTLELENKPVILSQMHISQEAFEAYTEGMRLVATEGTAQRLFKNYPVEIAAKTGTAQHGSGGSDHGAFVCYGPVADPEIAVVVYGEKAGGGSTVAQIAKEILDVYFSVDETGDVITNENQVS
jgi:penicillin-binding protein 2